MWWVEKAYVYLYGKNTRTLISKGDKLVQSIESLNYLPSQFEGRVSKVVAIGIGIERIDLTVIPADGVSFTSRSVLTNEYTDPYESVQQSYYNVVSSVLVKEPETDMTFELQVNEFSSAYSAVYKSVDLSVDSIKLGDVAYVVDKSRFKGNDLYGEKCTVLAKLAINGRNNIEHLFVELEKNVGGSCCDGLGRRGHCVVVNSKSLMRQEEWVMRRRLLLKKFTN